MGNSRMKTRERKQKRNKEESLERRNSHGHLDLVAYEAVKNIIRQQKVGETDKLRSD